MVTTKPARRDPARDLSAPRHQALGSLLGRVWAVDQVGVEERAASLAKRSIKHGLPAPVNQWLFKSSAFDRKDWNHVLLGECLKQLALVHDPKNRG